ncbi:MAG: ubiquinone biosynthesis protein UbiH, partial [Alphaproteobacteria bacterium]
FAQLPMPPLPDHPHVSAIVWTDKTAIAERCLAMDDAAYVREIARRLGIAAVDRMPRLKNFFARQAMGMNSSAAALIGR